MWYKVILTRRCLTGTALRYLAADCDPVSEMAKRRHLRSAARRILSEVNSCGVRTFSVLGLRLWNSLPRLLRDNGHNTSSIGHSLNTFLRTAYIGGFGDYAQQIHVLLRLVAYRDRNQKVVLRSRWSHPLSSLELNRLVDI